MSTPGPVSSTCTSSSTHVPPALRMSVRRLGQLVSVRPLTTTASTSVHGAWQITAIGLPLSAKDFAKLTASGIVRSWSGLATPPGSTRPSYDATSALSTVSSTGKVSALSRWLNACTFPVSGATSLGVPPAASTAFHGSVSSTCSMPSVATRNAIVLPLSSSAIPESVAVRGALKRFRGDTDVAVTLRLLDAINAHHPDAFAALVAEDYRSEQPAHPARAFHGRARVHENWSAVFAGIPDITAELLAYAVDGDVELAEWVWRGTHVDGSPFHMRGATAFGIAEGLIQWGRLYMEP